MAVKLGKQTYKPDSPPYIISTGTAAGPFEGNGPLKDYFDHIYTDTTAGERSFESSEKEMMSNACFTCLNKANVTSQDVNFFMSGDILSQTITSGFSALELSIPYLGIFGACSTSALGLSLATMLVDGNYARFVLASTSSHNSTAERLYRYPTEYGVHRKPNTQWTATGAGAALVASEGTGPRITSITIGKVLDLGIKDPLNLGAAMAPAAAATMVQHFADTGIGPEDYDLIVTGDLGKYGHELAIRECITRGGFDLSKNYKDCGLMLYDTEKQDVHAGGSGCACSALVAYGYLYKKLLEGELKKLLLVATGALHSVTSVQQGQNIPAIAHAVSIES